MTTPIIGQANPGAGYRELQTEIDAAVARALASGWYILGAEGRAFEAEYAAWLENLPDSLQDGTTAEALRTICDLDLSELQAIIPPRGFGRD